MINFLYDVNYSIENKIFKISNEIFHANEVIYSEQAIESMKKITKLGYSNLPICIAKTQYSITDDPKKLGYPKDSKVTVRDMKVSAGAGFIVVYMGNIMTMPGLSKTPAYQNIDLNDEKKIVGLF